MKKIIVHRPGSYDELKIENLPDLEAIENEVVIEVRGIGINYADCCVRWGVYESAKKYIGWPITPGFEFSGKVLKIGSKVTRFNIGDQVFGITFFNAYATQIKVHEKFLYHLPNGFSLHEAAGFPAVFMTAYHALFQLVKLPPKAILLIHSAGGGVGSALLQLAKAYGFRTVAVVGSSHKVEYVKNLGATHVIDKSQEDLWKKVKEYAPHGFDAVLDANGPSTLRESYASLRPTGKLIAYGSHSILPQSNSGRMNYIKAGLGLLKMPRFNPMTLISDNKSVVGFNLSFLFDRDDLVGEGMGELLRLVNEKKIQAPKITLFDFDQVGEAHRLIESGKSTGKIVLNCP